METIEQLRDICQKPEYKTKGNWMARNITRDMALPVSWVLLHTKITANQVTFLSLVVAGAACFLFGLGTVAAMFWGAVLLQLWYLLDHVDGHIARYRKQTSLTGIYFDYVTHYLVHAGVFIGIGQGVARIMGNNIYASCGWIAAVSIMVFMLVYDSMYKAFYSRIVKTANILKVRSRNGGYDADKEERDEPGLFKKGMMFLHKVSEIHVLMNIITVLALLSIFFRVYWWPFLIVFYAAVTPLLAVAKNVHFILKRVPDQTFSEDFEEE